MSVIIDTLYKYSDALYFPSLQAKTKAVRPKTKKGKKSKVMMNGPILFQIPLKTAYGIIIDVQCPNIGLELPLATRTRQSR